MKVFDEKFVEMVRCKCSCGKRGFKRGFGSVMGFLTDQFDEKIIEKFLERGDIKYLILNSLNKEPMHGYQLISDVEKEFQGLYSPSPGAVYPTLQMLEEAGWVKSKSSDGKKIYSLTNTGKKELENNKARVNDIFSRMSEHREKHWFGREMRNLTNVYGSLGKTVFMNAKTHYSSEGEKVQKKLEKISKLLEKTREEIVTIWSS